MKRKTSLILMLIVGSFMASNMNAQIPMNSGYKYNNSKFHVILDYHYLIGLSESGYLGKSSQSDMYANSMHFTALYSIRSNWAVGAGIGADRYENPGFNTFPLYATVHYSPIKKYLQAYTYSNVGYSINSRSGAALPGALFDLGVGYKLMLRNHFGFNFQFGYNYKNSPCYSYYTYEENTYKTLDTGSQHRHSLAFGFGLIF